MPRLLTRAQQHVRRSEHAGHPSQGSAEDPDHVETESRRPARAEGPDHERRGHHGHADRQAVEHERPRGDIAVAMDRSEHIAAGRTGRKRREEEAEADPHPGDVPEPTGAAPAPGPESQRGEQENGAHSKEHFEPGHDDDCHVASLSGARGRYFPLPSRVVHHPATASATTITTRNAHRATSTQSKRRRGTRILGQALACNVTSPPPARHGRTRPRPGISSQRRACSPTQIRDHRGLGAEAVEQNSQQSTGGIADTITITPRSTQAPRVRGWGPPSIQSTMPTTIMMTDTMELYIMAPRSASPRRANSCDRA